MNYFICPPSPSSDQFIQKTTRHLLPLPLPLPLPIHLEPPPTETTLDPNLDSPHITTTRNHPLPSENNLKSLSTDTDLDPVSQVFFKKKTKETDQFVDMIKVESSHTRSNAAAGIILPPPTAEEGANFLLPHHQFDEAKGDPNPKVRDLEYRRNIGIGLIGGDGGGGGGGGVGEDEGEGGEGEGEGGGLSKLKIFQWSLSGMAAVAATVCIIVLSNGERKHPHVLLNQIKFRFQICGNYDDKHRRTKARRSRSRSRRMNKQKKGAGRVQHLSSAGVAGNDPLGSMSRYSFGGYYCDAA